MLSTDNLPILQVLIPFLGALVSAITNNRNYSYLISTICAILSLIVSIYVANLLSIDGGDGSIIHNFGGFVAPIGIEYKLDYLNQPIIVFVNFVLSFFLLFGRKFIGVTILSNISARKQHYFYPILLFAHTGHLGVLSTNDLFNFYVFIEISSLSTYILMSKGQNRYSVVGAFDYLIMGSIGATMILIGIGFLLAKSGSLNITDISKILDGNYDSKIITTAIVFFLTGAVLKMAFFPMHFWMVRAYSSSSSYLLTYVSSISGLIGVYMIIRFIFFVVSGAEIQQSITNIFNPLSIATIIVCTFLALRSNNLKKIIIYSAASQTGYTLLLMTIWAAKDLMFLMIILDGINKIALFIIIALIEEKTDNLEISKLKLIESSVVFKIAVSLSLLFSASIPISSMFLVKLQIFELLLNKNLMLEFIVVLLGSVLALLYHLRIIKVLFFAPSENGSIKISNHYAGLIFIVIIQISTLIYINPISYLTYDMEAAVLKNKNQ